MDDLSAFGLRILMEERLVANVVAVVGPWPKPLITFGGWDDDGRGVVRYEQPMPEVVAFKIG